MKKIGLTFLCCFLLAACTPKGIIPGKTMAAINADLFLLDQYAGADQQMRSFYDTCAIYLPVLRSYGYTAEDYFASVDYYLENSRDMAKIISTTEKILLKRKAKIQKNIDIAARKADTTSGARPRREVKESADTLVLEKPSKLSRTDN
ncbi:MAG: DUF4296 domain-containing protein [Bacteroidales bacterium]|nr:DUF4296 domain-containing protein [Bacteroidales bacterium]